MHCLKEVTAAEAVARGEKIRLTLPDGVQLSLARSLTAPGWFGLRNDREVRSQDTFKKHRVVGSDFINP